MTAVDVAAERARYPEVFRHRGWLRWVLLAAVFGYLAYLLWLFDFIRVFTDLPRVWLIVRLMLDWSHFAEWDHAELWQSMLETVAMAYLGSMLAVLFAVPLGFLGARNIIPARVFHFVTRRLFDGLRGLDSRNRGEQAIHVHAGRKQPERGESAHVQSIAVHGPLAVCPGIKTRR